MTDQDRDMPSENREPDTARSYERAKPEKEAGMGDLSNAPGTPERAPDRAGRAVKNAHAPRQINAEDARQDEASPPDAAGQPDYGSLEDEEPRGEDLVPTDIHDPRMKRHPRREGKGGTP